MYKLTWRNRWDKTKRVISGISCYPTIQQAKDQLALFGLIFPDNEYNIVNDKGATG